MVYGVKRRILSSRRIAALLLLVICAIYILPFDHPKDEIGGMEEGRRIQDCAGIPTGELREGTKEGEEKREKITGEKRVKQRARPMAPLAVGYFGRVDHALGGSDAFENGLVAAGRLGEAKRSGEIREDEEEEEEEEEEEDIDDSESYPGDNMYDYTSEEDGEGFEIDYGQAVPPLDDREGGRYMKRHAEVVKTPADEEEGGISLQRDGEAEIESIVDQELAEYAREEERVARAVYNGKKESSAKSSAKSSAPRFFTLHHDD